MDYSSVFVTKHPLLRRGLGWLFLFTLFTPISATRVKSEWRLYSQPDGSSLQLLCCGDEYSSFFLNRDGQRLTRDSLGFFQVLSPEENGSCTRTRQRPLRRLPLSQWNPQRTYRQMVILFSFSDTEFQSMKPRETYDSIFNSPGFNRMNGPGCVADYFRDQSGSLFNLQFDVFGPYKVSGNAQGVEHPDESTRHFGVEQIREATKLMLEDNRSLDFSAYDWNGDGHVNQVVYVYAGYSGNQTEPKCFGHIWPHTSSIGSIATPDGHLIDTYSVSGELWASDTSCGIGTICHEFSHTLGLPDIYPTGNSQDYSVVDEWDLMDGGNFTNYGWCPPNYTALEKMLLGWLTPIELTEPATITDMKPVADGGEVYLIRHTDSEYLLLENRQWHGWDYGLPGQGLVVYHVNYDADAWQANEVNSMANRYRFELMPADNLNYKAWDTRMSAKGSAGTIDVYRNAPRLNSYYLSSAAFPWINDSTQAVYDMLSDTTAPATVMHNENNLASNLLSKPVTNICMNGNGLVSFDFQGDMSRRILVNFSPFGQATFYSSKCAHLMPDGLTASVVTGIANQQLLYQPIAGKATGSRLIPKCTAVFLTNDTDVSIASCILEGTDDDTTYDGPNLLAGTDTPSMTTSNGTDDCLFYKLTYGYTPETGEAFGWFWGEANGGPFMIDAHKAWLALPKSQASRGFIAGHHPASIDPSPSPAIYYDLQGRQINGNRLPKGLYIYKGKKIVISQ